MRPLNPALCPSLLVKYDKSAGTCFKVVIIAVGLFVLFCFVLFFHLRVKVGRHKGSCYKDIIQRHVALTKTCVVHTGATCGRDV